MSLAANVSQAADAVTEAGASVASDTTRLLVLQRASVKTRGENEQLLVSGATGNEVARAHKMQQLTAEARPHRGRQVLYNRRGVLRRRSQRRRCCRSERSGRVYSNYAMRTASLHLSSQSARRRRRHATSQIAKEMTRARHQFTRTPQELVLKRTDETSATEAKQVGKDSSRYRTRYCHRRHRYSLEHYVQQQSKFMLTDKCDYTDWSPVRPHRPRRESHYPRVVRELNACTRWLQLRLYCQIWKVQTFFKICLKLS